MILSDGNTQITYFKNFPTDIKNIGLSLSGGTDSALILFLLTKMIKERNQSSFIYPIHGYDIARKNVHSYEAAQAVIDRVKDLLDDTTIIQPPHIFAYNKKLPITKDAYHAANYEYMQRRYNIPFIIRGITQGMPDDDRPLTKGDGDSKEIYKFATETFILPFGTVDKRFIAHQYEIFELDSLYKVTSSCIADSPEPCKQCWWCKEKYFAFKSYDGCVQ